MKAIRYEKDTVLIQEGKKKNQGLEVDVVVNDGKLYYDWNKMNLFLWKKMLNFENGKIKPKTLKMQQIWL